MQILWDKHKDPKVGDIVRDPSSKSDGSPYRIVKVEPGEYHPGVVILTLEPL